MLINTDKTMKTLENAYALLIGIGDPQLDTGIDVHAVYNILIDEKYIADLKDGSIPSPGDIIEFEATLRRNPILETIESFLLPI